MSQFAHGTGMSAVNGLPVILLGRIGCTRSKELFLATLSVP